MGIEWFGLAMGLGFVLSFGYWCTDFLVVQRAMAAESMSAARRTPLIAAMPKMFFPFLVIVPGIIAVALPSNGADAESGVAARARHATRTQGASFRRRSTRKRGSRSSIKMASRSSTTTWRFRTC